MNIPMEILIVAVIAAVIITVVIAIVIKKRNQEIDDDYQWSDEHRAKRARQKKNKKNKEQVFLEDEPKADSNPAKDVLPEADILIDPKANWALNKPTGRR